MPEVIDLSDPALVFHLFQCMTDGGASCESWDYESGANACVLLDRNELSDCLVRSPGASELIGELWIAGWRREEDQVALADSSAYLEAKSFDALSEEDQYPKGFDCHWSTKAGGVPYWTANGPGDVPPRPFEFLLQFDTLLFLKCALPEADAAGCLVQVNGPDNRPVSRHKPGHRKPNAPRIIMQDQVRPDEYYCQITNLGSDGTAYVFIDRSQNPARAVWLWNR